MQFGAQGRRNFSDALTMSPGVMIVRAKRRCKTGHCLNDIASLCVPLADEGASPFRPL